MSLLQGGFVAPRCHRLEVCRGELGWGLHCSEEAKRASEGQDFGEVTLEETCLVPAKFISICKGVCCQGAVGVAVNARVISGDALAPQCAAPWAGSPVCCCRAGPGAVLGAELPGRLSSSGLSASRGSE